MDTYAYSHHRMESLQRLLHTAVIRKEIQMEINMDNLVQVSSEMIGQVIRPVFGPDDRVKDLASHVTCRMLEGMAATMGFGEEISDDPLVSGFIKSAFGMLLLGMCLEREGVKDDEDFDNLITARAIDHMSDSFTGIIIAGDPDGIVQLIMFGEEDKQEEASD